MADKRHDKGQLLWSRMLFRCQHCGRRAFLIFLCREIWEAWGDKHYACWKCRRLEKELIAQEGIRSDGGKIPEDDLIW